MADKKLTDRSAAMEHDLEVLGNHIAEAQKHAAVRRKDADPAADVAGEQDHGGGDDPVGAEEDAEAGSSGGAQGGS